MIPVKPFLSILIPTRNRYDKLSETLDAFISIINNSKQSRDLEIVVADNFSECDIESLVSEKSKICDVIRYHKHHEERLSAESSMAYAVDFCRGDYVWCFGDDDIPKDDCLDFIITSLKNDCYDFVLLNCDIISSEGDIVDYIKCTSDIARYDKGIDLFKDFGLISATTTLSCLLFKKELFSLSVFKGYIDTSQIYSHSFSMCEMFHDKVCGFFGKNALTYRMNDQDSELSSISSVYDSSLRYYAFTIGLWKLIERLGKKLPINSILNFNEIVIQKDNYYCKHSKLSSIVFQYTARQYQEIFSEKNDLKIEDDLECFVDFLNNLIASGFYKDVEVVRIIIYIKNCINALLNGLKVKYRDIDLSYVFSKIEDHRQVEISPDSSRGSKAVIFHDNSIFSRISGSHSYIENDVSEGCKISILMPVLNKKEKVISQLEFLCNLVRPFNDIEIFVVLGGNDIDLLENLRDLSNKNKFIKFKVLSGLSNVTNGDISSLLELCSSNYVLMMRDDGDIILSNMLVLFYSVRRGLFKDSELVIINNSLEASNYSNFYQLKIEDYLRKYGVISQRNFFQGSVLFNKKNILDSYRSDESFCFFSHIFLPLKSVKRVTLMQYAIVSNCNYEYSSQDWPCYLMTSRCKKEYDILSGEVMKRFIEFCRSRKLKTKSFFSIKESSYLYHSYLDGEILQCIINNFHFIIDDFVNRKSWLRNLQKDIQSFVDLLGDSSPDVNSQYQDLIQSLEVLVKKVEYKKSLYGNDYKEINQSLELMTSKLVNLIRLRGDEKVSSDKNSNLIIKTVSRVLSILFVFKKSRKKSKKIN